MKILGTNLMTKNMAAIEIYGTTSLRIFLAHVGAVARYRSALVQITGQYEEQRHVKLPDNIMHASPERRRFVRDDSDRKRPARFRCPWRYRLLRYLPSDIDSVPAIGLPGVLLQDALRSIATTVPVRYSPANGIAE